MILLEPVPKLITLMISKIGVKLNPLNQEPNKQNLSQDPFWPLATEMPFNYETKQPYSKALF